jgi:hypothetical protein
MTNCLSRDRGSRSLKLFCWCTSGGVQPLLDGGAAQVPPVRDVRQTPARMAVRFGAGIGRLGLWQPLGRGVAPLRDGSRPYPSETALRKRRTCWTILQQTAVDSPKEAAQPVLGRCTSHCWQGPAPTSPLSWDSLALRPTLKAIRQRTASGTASMSGMLSASAQGRMSTRETLELPRRFQWSKDYANLEKISTV